MYAYQTGINELTWKMNKKIYYFHIIIWNHHRNDVNFVPIILIYLTYTLYATYDKIQMQI